ncbi:ATP-binding protein [Streptomyces sp. NPDC007095]|uniref:ATP-binding protein n=1 Tax=Streptomyces sp. NPDC007095 TaxID=3154482 RepID=UPI0033DBF7F2
MSRARLVGAPVMSEVLPRELESVPVARYVVRDILDHWDLRELAEDAETVISELTTNAILHARMAAIRITVTRVDERTVRLAVIDRSRVLPVLRSPDTDDVHGRGMGIVDALTRCWGTDRLPWGKRVWAELRDQR